MEFHHHCSLMVDALYCKENLPKNVVYVVIADVTSFFKLFFPNILFLHCFVHKPEK